MTRLDRATLLLLPQMGIDRRDMLLMLAFHGEHRPVYDGIAQSEATDALTVAGVRMLLDRGCVGSRHALVLEVARREARDEKALAVQPGCRELLLLVDQWEDLYTYRFFVAEKIDSQFLYRASHRSYRQDPEQCPAARRFRPGKRQANCSFCSMGCRLSANPWRLACGHPC